MRRFILLLVSTMCCLTGIFAQASIEDSIYGERSGDYFIESVETTFGKNGGRRTIEIGIKA